MKSLLLASAMLVVSAAAVQAEELRIALSTLENGLDPQYTTSTFAAPVLYQIFDTLIKPHELYAMREAISFDIPIAQRPYMIPLRGGAL